MEAGRVPAPVSEDCAVICRVSRVFCAHCRITPSSNAQEDAYKPQKTILLAIRAQGTGTDRVGRTLLSVAFDFDFDFDLDCEGHDLSRAIKRPLNVTRFSC